MSIDPAAGIGRHLERGGHIQQLPGAADLREYALSVGPEQPEIAVNGGEEPVDADMTLGHHRMKYATHPGSRSQPGFIGRDVTTGAKYGSVRTPVSYTHLRAHETRHDLVCRLLL